MFIDVPIQSPTCRFSPSFLDIWLSLSGHGPETARIAGTLGCRWGNPQGIFVVERSVGWWLEMNFCTEFVGNPNPICTKGWRFEGNLNPKNVEVVIGFGIFWGCKPWLGNSCLVFFLAFNHLNQTLHEITRHWYASPEERIVSGNRTSAGCPNVA